MAFAYVAHQVSTSITINVDGTPTTYSNSTFPGAALGTVTSSIAIAGATLVVDHDDSPKVRGAELRVRVLKVASNILSQVLPVLESHAQPLYHVTRLKATYDPTTGARTTTFQYSANAATVAVHNLLPKLEAGTSYQLHVAFAVVQDDSVQEITTNDGYQVATFTTHA
ncbi:MAG: hypothetical protein KGL42_13625 [Betaproteobacteria bacterium]|nr:hypothetical protein [Betaproteobacteria bacterium]